MSPEPSSIFLSSAGNEVAKSITSDIYISAKKWFSKLDPALDKLSKYRDGIEDSLGKIQIMGMSDPRRLTNLYIALKVLPQLRKHEKVDEDKILTWKKQKRNLITETAITSLNKREVRRTIEELGYKDLLTSENEWEINQLNLTVEKEEEQHYPKELVAHGLSAIDLIDENDKIAILGQPGSGKTTFLKYLALAYSGFTKIPFIIEPLLPVFVPLRELKRIEKPKPTVDWLLSFVISCASEISGQSFEIEWLKEYLKTKNCLILLDGVDEIDPESIADVMQSINAFCRKYRGNKFVVTCRSAVFNYNLEGFKICEIADFNEEDIKSFLIQWFQSDDDKISDIISYINGSRASKELCKTPLLLTMVCILYEYNQNIPNNRYELYDTCVDALFFRWDSFRYIKRPSLTRGLGHRRKKMILSRIARSTFDDDIYHFKQDVLEAMLKKELTRSNLTDIDPQSLLDELEAQNGLFIQRALNVYSFSHLTFQEFFTAIAYHEESAQEDLLTKAINEPRYREVFLMFIEMSYQPDEICLALAKHIKECIINAGRTSEYYINLITGILSSNSSIDQDIRTVLNAVRGDLFISDTIEYQEEDDELAFMQPNNMPD